MYFVSIIIPVYNNSFQLEKLLESLVFQSYKNIEILCIDDGSTDSSLSVLNSYKNIYSNIRVFEQNNTGVSSARNTGIENAIGDFIFFCDADDWIDLDLIEKLIESVEKNPKGDIFACGFYKEYQNSKDEYLIFNTKKSLAKKELSDYLLQYAYKPNKHPLFVTVWGKLIRSEIIHFSKIRFLENLTTFEDVLFNFELLKKCNSVVYIPISGYHYTIHQSYNSASMASNDLFGFVPAMLMLKELLVDSLNIPNNIAHKAISNALISYSVIQTIRLCSSISIKKYFLIKNILEKTWLKQSLEFYRPTEGDSKIIPFFFKYKMPLLVILISYNKFHNRYK